MVGARSPEPIPVEPGYRWLTIQHEGYSALDTLVYAMAGRTSRVAIRLAPLDGGLESRAALESRGLESTSPPGSRPAVADSSPRGRDRGTTAPAADEVVTPAPASAETGIETSLTVRVQPAGATILVDGIETGHDELQRTGLPPGRYTIAAQLEGYRTASRTISLEAGQSQVVEIALRPSVPQTGTLAITVRPWGSIFVDGALLATDTDVRFTTPAAPGTRVVRAVHPQLGSREVTVRVTADEVSSVVIDLVP